MRNFLAVACLDTFDVIAGLHKRKPLQWKGVPERGEVNLPEIGLGASMLLRAHKDITRENWLEDLPVEDTPELFEWHSMFRLLEQARFMIMHRAEQLKLGHLLSGEMARAMVSRLDPGSTIFWHVDDGPYHARTVRFHLPLVTNPGCRMYSGDETLHMTQGVLWYFNNHVRHSAANFGEFHRMHLIFEMYRAAA